MQCTTTVRPDAEDWQPPTLGFNLQVMLFHGRRCQLLLKRLFTAGAPAQDIADGHHRSEPFCAQRRLLPSGMVSAGRRCCPCPWRWMHWWCDAKHG